MKTQVIISVAVAISLNLIVVGMHFNQYLTEQILTYACVVCSIWFFAVAFTALLRKVGRAS